MIYQLRLLKRKTHALRVGRSESRINTQYRHCVVETQEEHVRRSSSQPTGSSCTSPCEVTATWLTCSSASCHLREDYRTELRGALDAMYAPEADPVLRRRLPPTIAAATLEAQHPTGWLECRSSGTGSPFTAVWPRSEMAGSRNAWDGCTTLLC